MEINKKISTLIRKEKVNNSLKKETFQMRLNLLKNNSIDHKLTNAFIFSMPIYLIEGVALAIISHMTNYTLPISNVLLPGIIVSSSLVSGMVINSIVNKVTGSYEAMKNLTDVESDNEIEEELIRNEIELAKIHNRSLALNSYLHNRDYGSTDIPVRRLKSELEELKIEISNKLSELDTLTTKNYLIKKFGSYFNNVNMISYLGAFPLAIAATTFAASCAPLIAASISPTIISNMVLPLIIGEVCGIVYQADKVLRNKDLYYKFNDELGKDKIKKNSFELIVDGTAIDQEEYKIDITICSIIELIDKCNEIEYYIEQSETSDNDQEKAKNNQPLEDLKIINGINEKPLIHKLEPKRTNH